MKIFDWFRPSFSETAMIYCRSMMRPAVSTEAMICSDNESAGTDTLMYGCASPADRAEYSAMDGGWAEGRDLL